MSPTSIAARTLSIRCAALTGLVRKFTAPPLIAFTLAGMSPWPVRMITASSTPRRAISACTARPSIPFMRRSTIAHPRLSVRATSRKASPLSKAATSNPCWSSNIDRASRTAASSSTT